VRLCRRSHKKIDAEPAVEMTSSARHLFCCLRFADFGVTVAVQPLTHTQHNHGWRVHAQHVLAIHLSQDVAAQNSCLYMYTYTYMYMHMHIIDILTCIYMSFLWQDHFWQHHRGWLERAAMESELCAACLSLAQALLSHPNPPKHHIIRKGTCPGLPGGISSLPGDQARILQGPENARIHPYPDARARTHTHTQGEKKLDLHLFDKIRPDECNWTMEKQISGSWPNLVNVLSRIPLRRRGKEKWVGGAEQGGERRDSRQEVTLVPQ